MAVLGFLASKCLSSQRLKAIAALLAVIMHISTRKKRSRTTAIPGDPAAAKFFVPNTPRKNPINAKGNANNVWENFTRLR
jgi:hypothetical protein